MNRHLNILNSDQKLLSSLSEGGGEPELQEEVLLKISTWIEEYTPLFCEHPWSRNPAGYDDESFPRRAKKLWEVWKSHFKEARKVFEKKGVQVNLFDVAQKVQQGTGYTGQGKLGGNPFQDILLVDAILQEDQVAQTFFYEEFKSLALKINKKEDWWNEFYLTHVLEKKEATNLPVIASYQGLSGLSRWINTSAKRFLSNWESQKRKERGAELTDKNRLDILIGMCTEEQKEAYHQHFQIENQNRQEQLDRPGKRLTWLRKHVTEEQKLKYQNEILHQTTIQEYNADKKSEIQSKSNPDQEKRWDDCIQMLGRIVFDLINSFPGEDALILKYRFLEGLTLEEIGQIIGKNKGQLSRRLTQLQDELFEKLSDAIPEKTTEKEACEACLSLLNLPTFFKELGEWLKQTYREEQEDEQ